MEKSKDIKETRKDFRSKRGAFSRKSYDGRDGSRNRRVKGKRDGLKRRKLEVGAEFHDRELGIGAVKEINKESMTVQFGVIEKIIPRRKHTERRGEPKPFVKRKYAKDDRNPVFKFDRTDARETERNPGEGRSPVKIGLHVVDDILGPGVVGKITERGTYVTYERTGEFVLYPSGLPVKLLKSAFPETGMKKKKPIKHSGGVARIYKVPPVKMALKDVKSLPVQAASTRKERIMTNYIEVGSGTKVSNKVYGEGIIISVEDGYFIVDFSGKKMEFPFPDSLMDGRLHIIKK